MGLNLRDSADIRAELEWLFATIKHVHPVLTGLVEDYPAVLRGLFGCFGVRITHEFKQPALSAD